MKSPVQRLLERVNAMERHMADMYRILLNLQEEVGGLKMEIQRLEKGGESRGEIETQIHRQEEGLSSAHSRSNGSRRSRRVSNILSFRRKDA